jgi:uncharacterized membrane protein YkvA (DUF1232 family)
MTWLKRLATMVVTLGYVISPLDAVPDPIAGLGQLDDLGVVLLAVWYLLRLRRKPATR